MPPLVQKPKSRRPSPRSLARRHKAQRDRFVVEYLTDLNATQAAIRSGYSRRTATSQGSDLLRRPDIALAVAEGQARLAKESGVSATRTLEELRRLAFVDPLGLFDEHGDLKPIHEMTPEVRACIASVEVVIKNVAAGDGHTDTIHKLKLWDKPKALEMLGKHLSLLKDQVEITTLVGILDADKYAKLSDEDFEKLSVMFETVRAVIATVK